MGVATKDSSKMAPVKVLKPRPEWQWKVLKLGMLAICLILFVWQFSYIFNDYLDAKTTVTTEQGQCCYILKDSISHHIYVYYQLLEKFLTNLMCGNTMQKVYDSLALPAITICAPSSADGLYPNICRLPCL